MLPVFVKFGFSPSLHWFLETRSLHLLLEETSKSLQDRSSQKSFPQLMLKPSSTISSMNNQKLNLSSLMLMTQKVVSSQTSFPWAQGGLSLAAFLNLWLPHEPVLPLPLFFGFLEVQETAHVFQVLVVLFSLLVEGYDLLSFLEYSLEIPEEKFDIPEVSQTQFWYRDEVNRQQASKAIAHLLVGQGAFPFFPFWTIFLTLFSPFLAVPWSSFSLRWKTIFLSFWLWCIKKHFRLVLMKCYDSRP